MRKEKKKRKATTRTTNTENSVNIIVYENTIVLLFPYTHAWVHWVINYSCEPLHGISSPGSLLSSGKEKSKYYYSSQKMLSATVWIIWNIIVFFFYKWWEDLYDIKWPENRMLVIFWMEGQINFACSDRVFGESNDFNINRCRIS